MAKVKKSRIIPVTEVRGPGWIQSPIYDPERDGVTFSLLSTFKDCREKARRYLQGWTGDDTSFALLYGGITHHLLQEAYRQPKRPNRDWVSNELNKMERAWRQENPKPRERAEAHLQEAMAKILAVMPTYFSYWREDFSPDHTQWLAVERTFRIPWRVTTPHGRSLATFLRGRRDGLFTHPYGVSKGKPRLLETKTRSTVDEQDILDTMSFNQQINLYLLTAREELGVTPKSAVLNIIRKPALRQKNGEDWGTFTRRIEEDVKSRAAWYFVRMQLTVSNADIDAAKVEVDSLVSDFLMWYAGEAGHYKNDKSCIMFGQRCAYIKLCGGGTSSGLIQRDRVFSELEGD